MRASSQSNVDIVLLATTPDNTDIRLTKMSVSLAAAGYRVVIVNAGGKESMRHGVRWVGVNASSRRWARLLVIPFMVVGKTLALKPRVVTFCNAELLPLMVLLSALGRDVVFDIWENWYDEIASKPWMSRGVRALAGRLYRGAESRIAARGAGVIAAGAEAYARWRGRARNCALIQNYPSRHYPNHGVRRPPRPERVIFCGGGIRPESCTAELVAAAGMVAEARPLRLAIVGRPGAPDYVREVQAHPAWKLVDYEGLVPPGRVNELLSACSAAIVIYSPRPNHYDVRSNKVYEAMAASKPVIVSDFPRWRELIERFGCGVAVDPTSSSAIAAGILRLLDCPTGEQLGQAGRRAFETTCNWEAQEGLLAGFYGRILRAEH